MEAITVSAGKRVSRWAQALLGEAGDTGKGRTQPHQQPTNFWEGLSAQSSPALVFDVCLFHSVTLEKNHGVTKRAWLSLISNPGSAV